MKAIEILKVNDPWDIVGREVSQDDAAESFARLEQEMDELYSKPSAPFLKTLRKGQVTKNSNF